MKLLDRCAVHVLEFLVDHVETTGHVPMTDTVALYLEVTHADVCRALTSLDTVGYIEGVSRADGNGIAIVRRILPQGFAEARRLHFLDALRDARELAPDEAARAKLDAVIETIEPAA